jgi:hypothetical protein
VLDPRGACEVVDLASNQEHDWPVSKDTRRQFSDHTFLCLHSTSLGTVNLVAPIDRNFIDISAIIRFRLCTFEWPIE